MRRENVSPGENIGKGKDWTILEKSDEFTSTVSMRRTELTDAKCACENIHM